MARRARFSLDIPRHGWEGTSNGGEIYGNRNDSYHDMWGNGDEISAIFKGIKGIDTSMDDDYDYEKDVEANRLKEFFSEIPSKKETPTPTVPLEQTAPQVEATPEIPVFSIEQQESPTRMPDQARIRMHRIFAVHHEKEILNNQIKNLELQIKNERDRLAGPLTSEILREDIIMGINDLNVRTERLKGHINILNTEEIKLREEIQILREGGSLNLDVEEQKTNENKNQEEINKKDEELNNQEQKQENKNDEELPPLTEEPEQKENKEDNKEEALDTPEAQPQTTEPTQTQAQPQTSTQTQAQTTGLKKGKKYGVKNITRGIKCSFFALASVGSGILSISSTAGVISALSTSTSISAAVGAAIYAIPAIACAVFVVIAAKKAYNYFNQNKVETENAEKSR